MSKHLTGAECAAHYWEAHATLLAIKTIAGCQPLTDTDWNLDRAKVWHRFATHPHAHEDD